MNAPEISEQVQSLVPKKNNKPVGWIITTSLLIIILGASLYGNYQYLNEIMYTAKVVPNLETKEKVEVTTTTPTEKSNRETTAGHLTFEYPDNWHVTHFWTENSKDGRAINSVIDPNPVSTAPRGGPLGEITLFQLTDMEDPEDHFEEKLDSARDNYDNLVEEEITTEYGTVYHLKGDVEGFEGELLSGETFLALIQAEHYKQ